MKLILIGFMGAGKSTVAKQLSSILKLPIVEMDTLVLEKTNCIDIHGVFAQGGEVLLREMEIAIAKEYGAKKESLIISTGAGAISNQIVLEHFKQQPSKIFFLNATFATITSRLSGDQSRPLFQNIEQAHSLYNFRHPLYLKYADHLIDTNDRSTQEIAQEIADWTFYRGQSCNLRDWQEYKLSLKQ